MAQTSIEWCDFTFNGWEGCEKVSPGCTNCYAEARDRRFHDGTHWGPTGVRRRTSAENWRKPLAWNEAARKAGVRHRVFCASLADVFEDRPELVAWRHDLWVLIASTPHLDWLLLTKRPENLRRMLPWCDGSSPGVPQSGRPPQNVWLGTTVEDQQRADERIPALLSVPAAVRFLSCEPLLERVDLSTWLDVWGVSDASGKTENTGIDWVIIGGESGPNARPFRIDWARDLVHQCRSAGVAPFVKQLGARPLGFCRVGPANGCDDSDFCDLYESSETGMVCGEECRMRLVDPAGGDPTEWPEDLRVREFPR